MSDAGRWARVKAVFQESLAREGAGRSTYLDQVCAGDDALRAEVESLLAAHKDAGRLADGSPLEAMPASAVASLGNRLHRGERLGPYEIESKLGEGGMGEVYRARDTRLGRAVAIKVLPADFAADSDRLARFEREARATAALNHPNIVAIYDVGLLGEMPYLVTEMLEGETLRSAAAGMRLPVTRAVEYGMQVARALGAAHDRGILHRDLKPDNLFVTRDGRIKVLDFGLAKLIESDHDVPVEATETGRVLGTVAYMSPEQARGETVDPRTDIFSLGAVLYELIAGRRAFGGDTQADVLSAVIKDEPPSLCDLGLRVTPTLDRIVRRCLEKDRVARFRTAHDLAFALEALSAAPVDGPGPTPPGRRRWLMPLIAGIAFGAVAFCAGWFLESLRQTTPQPLYTQLTFRRGTLTGARFAPDGQTVVYSAAWDGQPGRVFTTRIGGRESRDLGEGLVWGVSASGDIAVRTGQLRASVPGPGMLARVSLSGGAPRPLLNDVVAAAWGPDGRDLAVARTIDGRTTLEYPMGRELYRTTGRIGALCVLPDGAVALVESAPETGDMISLVDGNKARRVLSEGWVGLGRALAWSSSTNELVFSGWSGSGDVSINAVTTSRSRPGPPRLVARVPGDIYIQDVDSRGRILLTHDLQRTRVFALAPGATQERDVSWLDYSSVADLSADGRLILLSDWGGELAPAGGGIAVRTTDGGPIIDLGRGSPLALSADGRQVLALPSQTSLFGDRLLVVPVGAGERRELRHPTLSRIFEATWFRDARRLVVVGGQEPERTRLYVWDADGRTAPQPISDEGAFGGLGVSPDGAWVSAGREGVSLSIYPTTGGTPRTVPGSGPDDRPLGWSTDGKWLFVRHRTGTPTVATIERVEVATGRRSRWKELRPAESAGLFAINSVVVTPDGRSYAYSFGSKLGTLYLVEGLK